MSSSSSTTASSAPITSFVPQGGPDLKDLLARSRALLPETSDKIHKPLGNVFQQSHRLSAQKAPTDIVEQSKAYPLLYGKGFDVENYNRALKSISIAAYEPLEPIVETDIDGFLKHEHDMIVLTGIEEAKKMTNEKFDSTYTAYVEEDWRSSRRALLQSLAVRKGLFSGEKDTSTISQYQPDVQQSGQYTPTKRGRTNMDSRMIAYATVVYWLNDHRRKDERFPLVQHFFECAQEAEDRESRKKEVVECWSVILTLIDTDELLTVNYGSLTALGVSISETGQQSARRQFLLAARRFLENQYRTHVKDVVMQSSTAQGTLSMTTPQQQQLGARMGAIETVKKYVNIRLKNSTLIENLEDRTSVNDTPLWPVLFYLVRCGYIQEAIQVAVNARAAVDENLITVLKNYDEYDTLPSKVFDHLVHLFRSKVQSSLDPFKIALFLVLGRCDTKQTVKEVFSKAEDFMWLKLCNVREGPESAYTLANLQELIRNHGPHYFCPPGRPQTLLYFKLLILTQQFEEAIAYLCSSDITGFQVEAVHFAIALYAYGMLNLQDDHSAPLLSSGEKGPKRLNFNLLIREYSRIFAHTDPREAISYYYIIKDEKVMLNLVKELVLESKDVSTIIGGITADGLWKRGCAEEFLREDQMQSVISMASKEFENTGRYTTAIDLYFLAVEHAQFSHPGADEAPSPELQKVLSIINKELSQVLITGVSRDMVISLANKILTKFERQHFYRRLPEQRQYYTFVTLLRLCEFFNLVLRGTPDSLTQALENMEKLALVPFDMQSVENQRARFRDLDDTIKRNFSDIMLATMTCLFQLYKLQKQDPSQPISEYIIRLRNKAAALLTFAGLIQEWMPSNVYSQLIRHEVLMRA